ncbi:MAG: hypothetical protein B7Y45_10075 [Sphingomonas sp. 28-66-16]|nr:MAG: hypothetical protein B7Y45_10075 [Sphingomonas sp. 28-66-16]
MADSAAAQPRDTLILVYNADGGALAALRDAVHKLVSPASYPCSLCAVSYGAVGMKADWRRFLDSLPVATRFHHRDDFQAAWPGLAIALPAILLQRGGAAPAVLIDAATLDAQRDVGALIETLRTALAAAR